MVHFIDFLLRDLDIVYSQLNCVTVPAKRRGEETPLREGHQSLL